MYAPILVTVYDRLEHLRNCINSLAVNKEACFTDLFIAVDYPLKPEHADRINLVKEYCKTITGFNSVNPIIRAYNFGPTKNYFSAMKQVFATYPSVIILEDDNIVSTNFLEYMNGALEFYEDDYRIHSVCGFNYPAKLPELNNDCYVWNAYNGYGSGWWRSKLDLSYLNLNNFSGFLTDRTKVDGLFGLANHILPTIFSGLRKGVVYDDAVLSYNLFLNKRYHLFPAISKVRNMGYDNSGTNCTSNDSYLSQPIDDGKSKIKFIKNIQPDKQVYSALSEFFKLGPDARRYLDNDIQEYFSGKFNMNKYNKTVVSPVTGKDDVTLLRKIPAKHLIDRYKAYNTPVDKFFIGVPEVSLYRCNEIGYKFFYPLNLEGDGEFYSQLQKLPWYYMEEKWEFSKCLDLLKSGEKVLEVGSGKGYFIKKLLARNINASGLELNGEAAEYAKLNNLPIKNETLGEHSKTLTEKYDVICAFQVLEHISDVSGFIKDCLLCLKDKGRLIFSVPNHSSFLKDDDENIFDQPPHHMGQWSEEALAKLASYFNMCVRNVATEKLAQYHYDHFLDIYKRTHTPAEVNAVAEQLKNGDHNIKGHTVLVEFVNKQDEIPYNASAAKNRGGLNVYNHIMNKQKLEPQVTFNKLLNLGCGSRYHSDWVNLDINPSDKNVVHHNLREPLPFSEGSIDVVYHSHVLEHFSKREAKTFIGECYKVLRKGGILRVAVPDLEQIALNYVSLLNKSLEGDRKAQEKYDWIMLELFDQMVRNYSGGEMLKYWQQEIIPAEDFVIERVGSEAGNMIADLRNAPKAAPINEEEKDPLKIGSFRLSGEIHQWMYDRYSLGRLLNEAGFRNAKVVSAHESAIPGFNNYMLDIEVNGKVRKPDSLFMEAVK